MVAKQSFSPATSMGLGLGEVAFIVEGNTRRFQLECVYVVHHSARSDTHARQAKLGVGGMADFDGNRLGNMDGVGISGFEVGR